jgi:hypothetical protein
MKLIKVIAVSITMLFGAAQAQNISIATGGTGGAGYGGNTGGAAGGGRHAMSCMSACGFSSACNQGEGVLGDA